MAISTIHQVPFFDAVTYEREEGTLPLTEGEVFSSFIEEYLFIAGDRWTCSRDLLNHWTIRPVDVQEETASRWIFSILKIISYATVLLPLLAILSKAICRANLKESLTLGELVFTPESKLHQIREFLWAKGNVPFNHNRDGSNASFDTLTLQELRTLPPYAVKKIAKELPPVAFFLLGTHQVDEETVKNLSELKQKSFFEAKVRPLAWERHYPPLKENYNTNLRTLTQLWEKEKESIPNSKIEEFKGDPLPFKESFNIDERPLYKESIERDGFLLVRYFRLLTIPETKNHLDKISKLPELGVIPSQNSCKIIYYTI